MSSSTLSSTSLLKRRTLRPGEAPVLPVGLPLPPKEGALGPAPGKFAALRTGDTHYVLEGDSNSGGLVVCLGGINDFCVRFGALAHDMVAAGCRVLRFDFYGRGWYVGYLAVVALTCDGLVCLCMRCGDRVLKKLGPAY